MILFIDPSYPVYNGNVLFQLDSKYNRDNCNLPFAYLKEVANSRGIEVFTADYLINGIKKADINIYCSFGELRNYKKLSRRKDVILSSILTFEPPLICPKYYREILTLRKYFQRVFSFSEKEGIEDFVRDEIFLEKLYYCQPENVVRPELWGRNDRGFLVTVIANKWPNFLRQGLYRERIKAVLYFAQFNEIDLYGFGWDKLPMFPYWFSSKDIKKVWKGFVTAKHEILAKYNFSICFENSIFPGYVSEKIFDCFVAGTVPLYWGAPDVQKYIPKDCFIDMRDFKDYAELRKFLKSLKHQDVKKYKYYAKDYLNSELYKPFTKEYFAEMILRGVEEDFKNFCKRGAVH